jgi:hypothetical protein
MLSFNISHWDLINFLYIVVYIYVYIVSALDFFNFKHFSINNIINKRNRFVTWVLLILCCWTRFKLGSWTHWPRFNSQNWRETIFTDFLYTWYMMALVNNRLIAQCWASMYQNWKLTIVAINLHSNKCWIFTPMVININTVIYWYLQLQLYYL